MCGDNDRGVAGLPRAPIMTMLMRRAEKQVTRNRRLPVTPSDDEQVSTN